MAATAERAAYAVTEQSQSPEEFKVPALDLSLEWQRIHEPLKGKDPVREMYARLDRIRHNFQSYPKEAYGVAVRTYQPYRMDRVDGKVTLTADGYDGPIREVYNPHNQEHPWPAYRLEGINYQRALVEYETFWKRLEEEQLANAQEGDVFIWVSPPPSEILYDESLSAEEKKDQLIKLGYGSHTNTFVLSIEDGQVAARLVKSFSTLEDNHKLLQEAGEDYPFVETPTDIQLLGTVVKAKAGWTTTEVKDKFQELYEQTPEAQRIQPLTEEEKLQDWLKEEYIDGILRQARPLLDQVFFLLYHATEEDVQIPEIQQFIKSRTETWENAVAVLVKGENNPEVQALLEATKDLSSLEIEQFAKLELSELKRRILAESAGGPYISDQAVFPGVDPELIMLSMMMDQTAQLGNKTPSSGCGTGANWATNTRSSVIENLASSSESLFTTRGRGGIAGGSPRDLAFTYDSAEKKNDELKCKCPKCKKQVVAKIDRKEKTITCGGCGEVAPYQC